MPNAWGFANVQSKELVQIPTSGSETRYSYKDTFRDFPYNQSPKSCLNTVAARTLYKLIVDNLFVTAATFENGEEEVVIAHPWGSINHRIKLSNGKFVSQEPPDFKAFEFIAKAMKEEAGDQIVFQSLQKTVKEYEIGSITEYNYAIQGSLTDWGYGAGWDTSANDAAQSICTPTT